jgi:hypothetical protein
MTSARSDVSGMVIYWVRGRRLVSAAARKICISERPDAVGNSTGQRALVIAVGREFLGAGGAFLKRLLAIAFEHQRGGRLISISGITPTKGAGVGKCLRVVHRRGDALAAVIFPSKNHIDNQPRTGRIGRRVEG